MNYTPTCSVGAANAYLRAEDGNTFVVQLDRVTSSASKANQTLEKLGEFRGAHGGYDWTPLTDESGQLASVDLSGEVTLRGILVEGSPNLNFIMVTLAVEVVVPEPVLPPLPPVEPTMSMALNADYTVTVTFTGLLQAATDPAGPYVDVAATSPLTLEPDQMMQFARFRQP